MVSCMPTAVISVLAAASCAAVGVPYRAVHAGIDARYLGAALRHICDCCPARASRFLAPRWDYDRVLDAAVALFWVNAALSLACTTLLPFYFFKTRR